MDIYAKQIPNFDVSKPDNATLLSFVNTVAGHCAADATMQAKLGNIYTAFAASVNNYDTVYNPSKKDLLTDVLNELDGLRDKALTAWHTAILAALKSPNAAKQLVARQLVQLYKDYHMDADDEYMKQTTNIQQLIQAIESDQSIIDALPAMGLDDYLNDLKTKNEAFAAKMVERTAGTVGKTTGLVAAARTDVEQKYRTLMRMVNVVSSYEGGGVLDQFILVISAEIDHYRQIMARKGFGSGDLTGDASDSADNSSASGGSPAGSSDSSGTSASADSGNSGSSGDSSGSSSSSGSGSGSSSGDSGSDNSGSSGGSGGSSGDNSGYDPDAGDGME